MIEKSIDNLECLWGGYQGSRRSKPQSEAVNWSIAPVSGFITAFILPVALMNAGMLTRVDNQNFSECAALKWDRSIEKMFSDLAKINITKKRIEDRLMGFPRSIIGWACDPKQTSNYPEIRICVDVTITLAVLGRCVNNIFFFSREPNYDWDTLFLQNLLVDESFPNIKIPTIKLPDYL